MDTLSTGEFTCIWSEKWTFKEQAWAVRKLDKLCYSLDKSLYPVDSVVCFVNT